MDVKEAVTTAKDYVSNLFSDEGVSNLGLEEVEYDEPSRIWNITVGFSRPRPVTSNAIAMLVEAGIDRSVGPRSYKIVRINDNNRKVLSVKNRDINQ